MDKRRVIIILLDKWRVLLLFGNSEHLYNKKISPQQPQIRYYCGERNCCGWFWCCGCCAWSGCCFSAETWYVLKKTRRRIDGTSNHNSGGIFSAFGNIYSGATSHEEDDITKEYRWHD